MCVYIYSVNFTLLQSSLAVANPHLGLSENKVPENPVVYHDFLALVLPDFQIYSS